ncbi:MAG: YvrJ family protein [Cloacibacillus sp.]
MDELTGNMIQNGFSIAVASFLLIRMDKRLEELTKAVVHLGTVIEQSENGKTAA